MVIKSRIQKEYLVKKAISPPATLLQLEALEPRLLLSGVVTVSVVSGTLKITGDSADNQISIAQSPAIRGNYTIAGLEGTQVKIGATGTPGSVQVVNNVFKDISIDMSVGAKSGNAGNDTVELASNLYVGNVDPGTHLGTFGSLTYKGAAGNDQVFLGGTTAAASVTFNTNPVNGDTIQLTDALGNAQTLEFDDAGGTAQTGNVQVTIGTNSADTMASFLIALYESNLQFNAQDTSSSSEVSCELLAIPGSAGVQPIVVTSPSDSITATDLLGGIDYLLEAQNVTVGLGDGANLATLGTVSTTPANFASTILGNLSITGGKGTDDIVAANDTHGNFTANLGAGDNSLFMAGIPGAGSLGRVSGNLSYTGLGGADNIDLQNSEVDGTLTANVGAAGAHSNGLDALGATLKGAVTYTAGATGNNDVDFLSATLSKTLAVTTGAGDDTVELNGANIAGAVTVNPGSGSNNFYVLQNNSTSANLQGAVSYTASGDNTLDFTSATLGKTLAVTTGSGTDTVTLDGAQVTGSTAMKLGGGTNIISVGQDQDNGISANIQGAFTYTATGGTNDMNDVQFATGTFGGAFTVTTGASQDTVDLSEANIAGKVTLALGAGVNELDNSTTGIGPTIGGAFSYTATSAAGDSNTIDLTSPKFSSTVSVTTGASDDTVTLDGANISGATTMSLGAGTNDFESGTAATFGAAFAYTATGATSDTNTVNLASSTLSKTLSVTTGAGGDTVDLSGVQATGNATLALGAGDNTVQAIGATAANFAGDVGFTATGTGTNTVTLGDAAGPNNIISGGLTIKTSGSGLSTIDLLNMSCMHSVAISTGAGGSNVDLEGSDFCHINGTFSLTGGAGVDNVKVAQTTGFAQSTTFYGGVNLSLGAGNDVLNIGLRDAALTPAGTGDANTHATFMSSITQPIFNGGAGTNKMDYQNEGGNNTLPIANVFSSPLKITNFITS
jgi:hypothetical protein